MWRRGVIGWHNLSCAVNSVRLVVVGLECGFVQNVGVSDRVDQSKAKDGRRKPLLDAVGIGRNLLSGKSTNSTKNERGIRKWLEQQPSLVVEGIERFVRVSLSEESQ